MTTTSESLANAFELHRAGRLDDAERIYRQVLAVQPENARAWQLLGLVAHGRGQYDAAVESIGRAVEFEPGQALFHAHLSAANAAAGHLDEAIESMREAIRLEPNQPRLHDDLGLLMVRLGRWNEAAECFRRALNIRPDDASALINLGNTLNQQGRPLEALEWFQAVLRVQPQSVNAHNNLGNTLKSLGRVEDAIWHYRQALVIDPNHTAASQNLAHTLRSWNGEPLAGRTILVRCTYGLGDTLQFVRHVPALRRHGAGKVLLAAQPALHRLLAESGFDGLVEPEAKEPAFDVEVSIMDLRCLLREPDEAIAAEPYLHATQARTDAWRQAMDGLEGFRVGIAWQGNRQYAWDHHRSIALAEFEPLTQIEGVRLVSLQKGVGVEQLAKVPFVVEQLGNALDADAPFCDTAAVIKNLDLVITSDSAVAHLAGALGAPVWVALPFDADWRWQADKEDSQWYSTMRLFRQSARGDWPGVFARLKDAVATQANQNRR